jgi:AcrR family transcriptional regulator
MSEALALRKQVEPPPVDDEAGADFEPDGRRRRSQDSRARIVAAMLELVRGGDLDPGAEQVAAHAKVGLRTVFRHFKDMDSLYREMSVVIEGELAQVISQPLKGETWREQLGDLIGRRALAFEKIGPYKRASDVHRHASPTLETNHARLVEGSRNNMRRILPAEIADDALIVETLDLLLSYEAWSRLRREQGLAPKRAREVVEAAVRKVIGT